MEYSINENSGKQLGVFTGEKFRHFQKVTALSKSNSLPKIKSLYLCNKNMQSIKKYIVYLKESLSGLYSIDEASAIAKFYVEEKLSLSSMDIILRGDDELEDSDINILKKDEKRLLEGEPVQYVTNAAWFCDKKFYVDENVLIPRQETEILISEIVNDCKGKSNLKILDIGTGSGCIPISLKLALPDSEVYALDVSEEALEVARKNAAIHNCNLGFLQFDVLSDDSFPLDMMFDVIISNPPYVTDSEKNLMHKNVTSFEPDLALYVRDDDPLVFYREISQRFCKMISGNGMLWFEINERFADEVIALCKSVGFGKSIVIKDLNKKDRFIKSSL